MGRKRNKQNKQIKNRGGRSGADIIRVRCNRLTATALSSGVATIGLQPSSFVEANAIADVFELYRITALKYRLHRTGTLANLFHTAVYIAGVVDNAPALYTDAFVSPHCCAIGASATVPSPWKKVPKIALASYGTWYKTVAGSPDPTQEIQGQIYLNGNGTEVVSLEIQVTYEFKSPVTTSATPAMRTMAERFREKERLLAILATPSPSPNTQKPDTDRLVKSVIPTG